MKIPDAYFNGGFGQRIEKLSAGPAPDMNAGQDVAQAAGKLGAALLGTGTQMIKEQATIDRAIAQEQKAEVKRQQAAYDAEIKKTQDLRDTNTAKRQLFNFETDLAVHEVDTIDDPNIPPEDYSRTIAQKSTELADKIKSNLTENQWLGVEPQINEYTRKATDRAYLAGQKEINDQAWAEDMGAADAIVNNPVKAARDKIALLKDENFMSDTGRPAHEIEGERQKRVATVIDNEVQHTFNSTRDDLKSLQGLKSALQGKDKLGNFTYFPEMQQAKREDYVSSVKLKMEQATAKAAAEANRRTTEARQGAAELVTEFKDKVAKGWMPNTANDFQFVNAVRRASTMSPSLGRQFGEATTNMGSLTFRSELKKKDPLGTAAAERGVILQPINVFDQATLPRQVSVRLAVAKQLGVKAVFTGPEVDAFTDQLRTLDPRGQVAGIALFSKALGPQIGAETFNAAAEQIRIKDPSMSTLFKLVANGKSDVAQLYANGKALLTGEKKDFLQEKVTKLKEPMTTAFDAALGTAFLSMKDSRNTMKDAVALAYIGDAYQKNVSLDTLDKDLFQSVIKRVVGETTTTGNKYVGSGGSRKTTVIPPGMDEDTFLDAIKAIKPADIARMGGVTGMTDDEASQYLKKVGWHELGSGYTFVKDGRALYNKKGKPFIFRFN